jgi:deoxyguanosine kinase
MTTAYISLGSNLGDRRSYIKRALKMLAETKYICLSKTSDIVETVPLGQARQPKYLNAVAEIKTSLKAGALLKNLNEIEKQLGRVRKEKWSPRTIDLDILLFGNQVKNSPELTIPHPQMHLRSFVLDGLYRLNRKLIHPVLKTPVGELAGRLNGSDFVLQPDGPQLVGMAGIIGVGKTTLARNLARRLRCKLLLEPYDTNPFLPAVYAGQKELALHSQLYFLFNRTEQLSPAKLKKGQTYVSDYVFQKERVYAGLLLDKRQLPIHRKLYPACEAVVTQPVLVIYLTDSAENCLGRIHSRNRPYEQGIKASFLKKLGDEYDKLFSGWKICPVIRISKTDFDCNNNKDVNSLIKQIRAYILH